MGRLFGSSLGLGDGLGVSDLDDGAERLTA